MFVEVALLLTVLLLSGSFLSSSHPLTAHPQNTEQNHIRTSRYFTLRLVAQ